MNSLEARDVANGRTVIRNPDLCVADNGQTAGGTCGRRHVELVSRGDSASSLRRGRHQRGKN